MCCCVCCVFGVYCGDAFVGCGLVCCVSCCGDCVCVCYVVFGLVCYELLCLLVLCILSCCLLCVSVLCVDAMCVYCVWCEGCVVSCYVFVVVGAFAFCGVSVGCLLFG